MYVYTQLHIYTRTEHTHTHILVCKHTFHTYMHTPTYSYIMHIIYACIEYTQKYTCMHTYIDKLDTCTICLDLDDVESAKKTL